MGTGELCDASGKPKPNAWKTSKRGDCPSCGKDVGLSNRRKIANHRPLGWVSASPKPKFNSLERKTALAIRNMLDYGTTVEQLSEEDRDQARLLMDRLFELHNRQHLKSDCSTADSWMIHTPPLQRT